MHNRNNGDQALSLGGKLVFHLGRDFAVVLPADQTNCGQFLQFTAEHARGDSFAAQGAGQQAMPDFSVAAGAMLEIPDDSNFIFSVNDLLKPVNRAVELPQLSGIRCSWFHFRSSSHDCDESRAGCICKFSPRRLLYSMFLS